MYGFIEELKEAVYTFVAFKQPFSVSDIKELLDEIVVERGIFRDKITLIKVKTALYNMLEKGDIHGYCIIPKPIVDSNGPRCELEFSPHNPMSISNIEMLELPDKFETASCRIHPYYKQILRALSKTSKTSQDMIIRSILTHSLSLVFDQLK